MYYICPKFRLETCIITTSLCIPSLTREFDSNKTLDMLLMRIKAYASVCNKPHIIGLIFSTLTGARYNRTLRERIPHAD